MSLHFHSTNFALYSLSSDMCASRLTTITLVDFISHDIIIYGKE